MIVCKKHYTKLYEKYKRKRDFAIMMMKKICAGLLGAMLMTGVGSNNLTADIPMLSVKTASAAADTTEEPMKISINLAARSLALLKGNEKIRLYPIGPGKASTPTPTGYYKVRYKEVNPTWTDPQSGTSIPSGPSNPLGYRWIEFQGNYGIHGTNRPDSIGYYVSNGCVRMHEEDVEALYDLVDVGTPVEITYNRVVVEKAPDDTVVYYIYPDGYGWQDLNVSDVHKWLAGYGVGDFVSDADIENKIEASDGNPTYIAKVYPLYVNGKKLVSKAIVADNVTYLPAVDVANELKVALGWEAADNMLVSDLGKAAGVLKRDTYYCTDKAAEVLFKLKGSIDGKNYILGTNNISNKKPADTIVPLTKDKPAVSENNAVGSAANVNSNETTVAAEKPAANAEAKTKSLNEIYAEAVKD